MGGKGESAPSKGTEAIRGHSIDASRLESMLLSPEQKLTFARRSEKIRENIQREKVEKAKSGVYAETLLVSQGPRDPSIKSSDTGLDRQISVIREALKDEKSLDASGRNEVFKAAINQIFEREVFVVLVENWVADFNAERNQNKTYDELKNDPEFNAYIKKRGLEEIQKNLEADVNVMSEGYLDKILGFGAGDALNDQQKKDRETYTAKVSGFMKDNQELFSAYNSYKGRPQEFFLKFHKKLSDFENSFRDLFKDVPSKLGEPEKQAIIRELFEGIVGLCEEAELADIKFEEAASDMVKNKDNAEEWNKSLKKAKEKIAQEAELSQQASAPSQPVSAAGGTGEIASYSPGGTSSGYKVENNHLQIDAVPGFNPHVKIVRDHGFLIFEVEDKFADPGTAAQKRVTENEMPFLVNQLVCDQVLNEGLKSNDITSAADKLPELNSVIQDETMMNMVLNLLPKLRRDNKITREDLVVIRNLYNVIIHDDEEIPYISTRVKRLDGYLAQAGNASEALNVLKSENRKEVKSLTVSKLIKNEKREV